MTKSRSPEQGRRIGVKSLRTEETTIPGFHYRTPVEAVIAAEAKQHVRKCTYTVRFRTPTRLHVFLVYANQPVPALAQGLG